MVSAAEDIRQSLHYSRHQPWRCASCNRVLAAASKPSLRNINESTLTVLKDLISRAILFYEPASKLESITADRSQAYEGRLIS